MTESKPPTSNHIARPGQMASSAATVGHNYSVANSFPLTSQRPKQIQTTPTSSAAVGAPHMIKSSSPFRMTVPLVGSSKEPFMVTSFIPKGRAYPIEKLTVPLNPAPADIHVKASVKSMGLQKVNFVKQIGNSRSSSPAIVGHASIKKTSEVMKPVFVGAGLRQPSKSHQPTKTGTYSLSHGNPIHPSSWAFNQPDIVKTTVSNSAATIVRTRPPFRNATIVVPHDLSKKHSISQQPKSTVNISPTAHIPLSIVGHRTELAVSPLTTGNNPIYQVMTPNFQTALPVAHGTVKKMPPSSIIVSQAIPSPSSNSPGFVLPNSAVSTGRISVMTCGPGVTHVPYRTPLNKSSASIPIAKVYPQQQLATRVPVTSASGGRVSVPLVSSVSASIARTAPGLVQVGPIRSTSAASVFTTPPTTIMSTVPAALNKVGTNSVGVCSVLRWPTTFSQSVPMPMMTSVASMRPGFSVADTVSSTQPTISARAQQRGVVASESKSARLQAGSVPSVLQVVDSKTAVASHSQPGTGPSTPTMSPKPTILRRQRLENSNAPRKLPFSVSPNFAVPRKNLNEKPVDRRPVSFALSNNTGDVRTGMPVVIQGGNIMKPVLENQVHTKQQLNTGGGFTHKQSKNMKPHALPVANLVQDEGHHSYSIQSMAESKFKVEPVYFQQNSEPASASQMLQFQSQTMHTYAAESPQVMSGQHRTMSQASGLHSNTSKPGARSTNFGHQVPSIKPDPGVKNVLSKSGHHDVSSLPKHMMDYNYELDRVAAGLSSVKKEQLISTAVMSGLEQMKKPIICQPQNHLPAVSSTNLWLSAGSSELLAGISPRKRPRKQTHVVSDQPVVLENEESTDDADEWGDEAMPDVSSQRQNVSVTPGVTLLGQKTSSDYNSVKSEQSKTKIEEKVRKSFRVKSESTSLADSKQPSEYTDCDGIRYVSSRKRPSVAVLNRRRTTSRLGSNHYMRYSDIKVKRKKMTISDLAADRKRLKGVKVAKVALQLKDMISSEKEVWNRMQAVCEGLNEYKSTLFGDETFDKTSLSPSLGTPSSMSNSVHKTTLKASSTSSATKENSPITSPLTPHHRKTNRVIEEIENIEEVSQANVQRCRVVCDQLTDTKKMLLKFVDHRQLVTDILESSSNRKSLEPACSQSTKRTPKKKANS